MASWVKCTHEKGHIIYVNLDNADMVFRDSGKPVTWIEFIGAGTEQITVRETPEEILQGGKRADNSS
jgi:hypothetical protein